MDPILLSFISIIAALLVVGVFVWGIDNTPVIDPTFKQFAKVIIFVVAALYVIFAILSMFGLGPVAPMFHGQRR